jgi:L-fucose isomerase-like protein
MNVKPIFILSRGAGVFVDGTGRMEMVWDQDANRNRLNTLLEELESEVGNQATVLEKLLVSVPSDLETLFTSKENIDILLVYFLGVTPIESLLRWDGPIIAFSGRHTPAMALYALGEERHQRNDLFIALDYKDIKRMLRVCEVKKLLTETRILLFGSPPSWHLRWYGFPDLEAIRRKVGVQFVPVELRELIEVVKKADQEKSALLAEDLVKGAKEVVEPSIEQLAESAKVYLALEDMLTRKGANAMAINCLEITQSRKFSDDIINPCMGMSLLRDRGIASGCEMDIPGLLTMIILGHLSRKPAFMGNVVHANPETNVIKLSHCILPSRMPGFDVPPLPYSLRDYHGARGVTAFTEVPAGIEVTLARAHRNLDRIMAFSGEVLACDDTTFCRNTLTIQIQDVREFIRQAKGNHHAAVFGDYSADVKALADLLGCNFLSN